MPKRQTYKIIGKILMRLKEKEATFAELERNLSTGYNTIKAEFSITGAVSGESILTLSGLDDDVTGACKIEISVNGEAVFSGANDFSEENWEERDYQLKPGILRQGLNEIVVKNLEVKEGDFVTFINLNGQNKIIEKR